MTAFSFSLSYKELVYIAATTATSSFNNELQPISFGDQLLLLLYSFFFSTVYIGELVVIAATTATSSF